MSTLTALRKVRWQDEQVFCSGDEYATSLCSDIAQSKRSIDMEVYITEKDPFSDRVLSSLESAARRGVAVRLMVDGFGSDKWIRSGIGPSQLAAAGVVLRVWHPCPWTILRSFRLDHMFNLIATFNRRNHRKVVIIDGVMAYVGSMNMDKCHSEELADLDGSRAWRDTVARVIGSSHCFHLSAAFSHAFVRSWQV